MNNSTGVNDTGVEDGGDSDNADLIVQVFSVVLGCVGTAGNGFVLIIIFNFTKMPGKLTNYFIVNQTAVDLWCAIATIITYATREVSYSNLSETGQDAVCKFWYSTAILWGALTASTYNLVMLTMERYFKVVHPIAHKTTFDKKKALICIGFVWVVGLVWHGITLIPTSDIMGGTCILAGRWPNKEWQQLYGILNVTLMFFVPIGVQLFCYARILRVLRKRTEQMDSSSAAHTDNFSRAQRNVIKTSILLSLCYVLCWTWNQVFFFLYTCGVTVDFTGWFYHFTVIAVFSNSCVNPIIYIFKYEEFKVGMRKAFCKARVDPLSVSVTQTSSS